MASDVVITYDGTDITNSVLYASARFEAQLAAVPGSFEITVKDPNRTLDFITGKSLTLDIDGIRMYGGFVTQVSKQYFFPADNTADLNTVDSRQWVLRGVDYNILLDKMVLRNTANYTQQIPDVSGTPFDGAIIRTWFDNYFDLPGDMDTTSTARIQDIHSFDPAFAWRTQGATMRQVLDDFANWGGAIFYIDGQKRLWFYGIEDSVAPFGISDKPNGTTFIGFRDGEYIEDATSVVNDALVWGGSEWAGDGDIVFARRQNATSQTNHGRWQLAEVNVGAEGYKTQAQVDARANVIVDGNESGVNQNGSRGLLNPEAQFKCTWFGKDVPAANHMRPGDVASIELWVFSTDNGATPFTVDLPLRQVTISFPAQKEDGTTEVQFEGFFGVQNNDPYWLWDYLRSRGANRTIIATANDTSTSPPYGALYQGVPQPPTDNATTVFHIPWAYVGGTISVYQNGLFQIPGTDFTESDPAAGEFTMTTIPASSDTLYVTAFIA